jgi:hypothetical protein
LRQILDDDIRLLEQYTDIPQSSVDQLIQLCKRVFGVE